MSKRVQKNSNKKGTTHSSSTLFFVILFSIFPLCLRLFVVSSFYCVHVLILSGQFWELNNTIPFHTYSTIKMPVLLFEIRQNVAFEMHNVYIVHCTLYKIRIKCGLLCWSCARWIKYRFFFVYYLITNLFQNAMMLFGQFGIICLLFLGWMGLDNQLSPK